MREEGYYWVKFADGSTWGSPDWEVCYFNDNGQWEIVGSAWFLAEAVPVEVGPKLEPPA